MNIFYGHQCIGQGLVPCLKQNSHQICLSIFFSPSVPPSFCLSVFPSVHLSFCTSPPLSASHSVQLSFCLSLILSMSPSIHHFFFVSFRLSICPSLDLAMCHSVYLFIYSSFYVHLSFLFLFMYMSFCSYVHIHHLLTSVAQSGSISFSI